MYSGSSEGGAISLRTGSLIQVSIYGAGNSQTILYITVQEFKAPFWQPSWTLHNPDPEFQNYKLSTENTVPCMTTAFLLRNPDLQRRCMKGISENFLKLTKFLIASQSRSVRRRFFLMNNSSPLLLMNSSSRRLFTWLQHTFCVLTVMYRIFTVAIAFSVDYLYLLTAIFLCGGCY